MTYDSLTGALSRRGLPEVLAGPVGSASGLAVIYLDLNGFKAVNDEHGHDVGDALLTRVSARFAQVVPERGVLARVGGDEFVVVVPQVLSPELASALTRRLRACLDTAVELPLADAGASLTVSVGVSAGSSWSSRPPSDVELLMQAVDRAMYEDKRACARPGAQRVAATYPVPAA